MAAAAGPRPPAELIQHFDLPTRPSPPTRGLLSGLSGLIAHDSVDAKAYGAKIVAKLATIEKANRKYDRLSAEYERKLQAWRDHLISYQDLGEDVAAELLPRREAVIQTAIPAQRVEKTKEK